LNCRFLDWLEFGLILVRQKPAQDKLIPFSDLNYTCNKFLFLGDYVDRGLGSLQVGSSRAALFCFCGLFFMMFIDASNVRNRILVVVVGVILLGGAGGVVLWLLPLLLLRLCFLLLSIFLRFNQDESGLVMRWNS